MKNSTQHFVVQNFGHGDECMHQRQTSQESQGQQSVSDSHVDVEKVKGAGAGADHRIAVIRTLRAVPFVPRKSSGKQSEPVIQHPNFPTEFPT